MEKLKVYTVCSVSLICIFLFGGLLYGALNYDEALSVSAENFVQPVIVIDAGHGGEDGGASANGLLEKDINLSIALKLRDILTASGYKTVMVREEDISVYDNAEGTVRQRKVSDLKNDILFKE